MTVATLVTVAALPALWLMQRDSDTPGSAGVAAVGASGGIVVAGGSDVTTSTTVPETQAPLAVVITQPRTIDPARTTVPAGRRQTGTATFKRYEGTGVTNACMAPRAPTNVAITVRSLDTGRQVTCRNVVAYTTPPAADVVVVINTDTFLQMADTVDAPTPVEITW